MSDSLSCGDLYFCVGTAKTDKLGRPIEVFALADHVRIAPTGDLILLDKSDRLNLAFAVGHWLYIYAASHIDGSAVAIEHWAGQVNEPQ